jgi:hypothetical protein
MESNVHLVELNEYQRPEITEVVNREWVGIGGDNMYYQAVIDAYMESTTNSAVINGIVDQIYGKGLDATDSNKKPDQYAKMRSLISAKELKNVCQDLKLLGEGALQVSYSKGKMAKITHFPRETLRPEICNEDGDIEAYYYAADWSKVRRSTKLKRIGVFGSGEENEIYIIRRYVPGYFYVSPIDYQISYATLEKEIADYLINDCQNGFSGTKILNFNSGIPDIEKQQEIKTKVLDKLTGSNGEKVIVSFNNNAEGKATIDDVSLTNAPEHYNYLSEECKKMIMLTHRVTSPLLLGLSSANGFSSNADEIVNASNLFHNIVIKPYQQLITDSLEEIFAKEEINLKLYFKTIEPLEFIEINKELDKEVIEEETGIKVEDQKEDIEELSKEKLCCSKDSKKNDLKVAENLIELGEDLDLNDWEIIDEQDVDYENEQKFDKIIQDLEDSEQNKSLLSKIYNFISTGRAMPNSKSEQDKEVKGEFFKVRYYYYPKKNNGGKSGKARDFCVAMVKANKLYRKEDIIKMESKAVNPNWGPNGTDFYSIWKYKGGGNCHHSWRRVTFKSKNTKIDVKTSKETIGTRAAEIDGYKVTNDYQVSVQPKNLPNKGFLPSNPQGK